MARGKTRRGRSIIAYHGTTAESARGIETGAEHFNKSVGKSEWLGPGIYFFEDGPSHAISWAEAHADNHAPLAVIVARISLERCCDLFDMKWWPSLAQAWNRVQQDCVRHKTVLPVQVPLEVSNGVVVKTGIVKTEKSDCQHWGDNRADRDIFKIVREISDIVDKERSFASIRSVFLEGNALHQSSFIFDKAHVQICVIDPDVIQLEEVRYL